MPDTGSGIVYHYCSLEAFKSIIENKCLWLCDVEKSNDSAERIYFENIMLDQIDHYAEDLKSKNDADKELALHALQLVKEALQNPETERAPVYSCSFSYNGDQLSQWRGYADDGYGISIGFWTDGFKRFLPEYAFRQVNYNYEQAKQTCWDIIQTALSYCRESKTKNSKLSYNSILVPNVLSQVEHSNIFFKSSAFAEEQECRIALRTVQSNYNANKHSFVFMPARILAPDYGQPLELSAEKFRVAQHKLSSYIELSFSRAKDLITVINLGPKCLATPRDIQHFLECNNYEVGDIEINTSYATYR